ncbi:MAG: hypothetical protein ACK55Z_35095, partial [bacterium]
MRKHAQTAWPISKPSSRVSPIKDILDRKPVIPCSARLRSQSNSGRAGLATKASQPMKKTRPEPTPARILYGRSSASDGHNLALQPSVCIANPGLQNPQTGPVRFCKHVLFEPQAPTGHRNTLVVALSIVVGASGSASSCRRVA